MYEAETKTKGKSLLPRWVQAGAFATVVAVAVVVVFWSHSQRPASFLKNPDDFEILSAQDQIALYEDLEFYQWLAASDSTR